MKRLGVILVMLSFIMGVVNAVDCRVIQLSPLDKTAVISVEPETISRAPGDTFTDSIYVTDTPDITQWIFEMSFSPNVLHCDYDDIKEGPFLKQAGSTVFLKKPLENGRIPEVTCATLDLVPMSGSGTLAYIKWQVMAAGSCTLDLRRAILIDGRTSPPTIVPCDTVDGYFYTPGGIEATYTSQADYLLQAYPNPFTKLTTISYQLPAKSKVLLKVYNIVGELVATLVDSEKEPGYYSVNWPTANLSCGIYFLRVKCNDRVINKKVVLMR